MLLCGCPTPCAQGKDAVSFLEGLVTGDIAGLADGTGSLSVFTNDKGGIIDDTVITKVSDCCLSVCLVCCCVFVFVCALTCGIACAGARGGVCCMLDQGTHLNMQSVCVAACVCVDTSSKGSSGPPTEGTPRSDASVCVAACVPVHVCAGDPA